MELLVLDRKICVSRKTACNYENFKKFMKKITLKAMNIVNRTFANIESFCTLMSNPFIYTSL